MTTLLVGVTVGRLVGLSVTGLEVTGAAVTGVEVTGLEVTGAAVTGVEVTGVEVTGAEVTGAEVMGAEVTGAPDGAADTGVPVGTFVLLRVGILDGAPEDGECVLPEARGLFESVGAAVTGAPVTGVLESVGAAVTGTAVGEWVGLLRVMEPVVITSPVVTKTSSTMRVSMMALLVLLTGVSAVSKSNSSTGLMATTSFTASRRRPVEVQLPLPESFERVIFNVFEVALTTPSTNCNCFASVGHTSSETSAVTTGFAVFLVGEVVEVVGQPVGAVEIGDFVLVVGKMVGTLVVAVGLLLSVGAVDVVEGDSVVVVGLLVGQLVGGRVGFTELIGASVGKHNISINSTFPI